MMYIDAVTHGIDPIPTVSDEIRRRVKEICDNEGLEAVTAMLGQLDPDYLTRVDRANTRRIVHAVEVSLQAGVPYSTMLTVGVNAISALSNWRSICHERHCSHA